uniref:Uncharacterized protein n=1 Tax=Heterorhabditis bacteriophora TaxID=37862 RepID=A0A1I7WI30_HETBA
MSLNLLVSSASKALRKPLTMSGWTRPELPSGKGRSVQNYPHSPPEGEVGKSTEPKARLKKALKNREKNSPINLHLSQSSNSPSKCIETFHLLGRLRFVSQIAETPTLACSVPQPGLNSRTINNQLLLNTRRSKWNRRGSIPRPPHPTPRRLPLDHDSTCRVV